MFVGLMEEKEVQKWNFCSMAVWTVTSITMYILYLNEAKILLYNSM